jgi:hypothetical protein
VIESSRSGSLKAVIWLTIVVTAGWVICFWPAKLLRGEAGVGWMSLAAICCLVPGWIVVFLSRLAIFPNDLAAMLFQTLLRLGLVGAVALAVSQWRPELGIADFYGWLIGFYLLALAAETKLSRPNRIGS